MRRPSSSSREPLYVQIEAALREQIVSGEWPPGHQIPVENELCTTFGVSRVTVRQALRRLVEAGLLTRGRGRGTFVQEPTLTAGERGLRSFSEDMRSLGLTAGARVMEFKRKPASREVSTKLGLAIGAPVVSLHRLRTGGGLPIGIQRTYLPANRFPNLLATDFTDRSLYGHLEMEYGVVPVEAREHFWIAEISASDAKLLNVDEGVAAFSVERLTRDNVGPMEFTSSVMRGDRFRLEWVLRKEPSS